MPSPPAYDTFLSYNSLDQATVEQVAKALSSRQCKCFVDRWYLQPGRDWVEALERALLSSRSVALFIGPHEMGRWQQRERAWALDQLAGRSDFPVIPVLLPGCEPPLGFMKQLMWIDLRNDPADPSQLDALASAIRGEIFNRDGKPEPRAMICPYRGLLAFREEDSDFFFGRQKYTDELVERVAKHSIVAVTGASGSGKSSVVRAGLVPQLRKRGEGPVWDILTMFPRENPLHSLADVVLPLVEPELKGIDLIEKRTSLARKLEDATVPLWDLVAEGLRRQKGTDRLLLVVDQWEELYTACKNDTQRNRFIQELLDTTSRVGSPLSVVFTVRWDFYGHILQNRPLLDHLEQSRLDLGPMNREELQSAIEGPGGKVGLTFQDGLVDRILDDAREEPGSLPLLEFVLEELWKCRGGDDQLTHDAYAKQGRLKGAIATRAEDIYSKLGSDEQKSTESLFRRLVQAGSKTDEDTRRRADLKSLDAKSHQLARKLADERLLVTTRAFAMTQAADSGAAGGVDASAGETVEVAHEELIRRWERLKQWVDADRQFLQWRSRLIPRLEEYKWDSKSAILTGNALRESWLYFPSRAAELDKDEQDFLNASHNSARHRKIFRWAIAAALVCLLISALIWIRHVQRHEQARNLITTLLGTPGGTVDFYLKQLEPLGDVAVEYLRAELSNPNLEPTQRLHAVYGIIQFDLAQAEDLTLLLDGIPDIPKEEGANVVNALSRLLQNKEPLQLEVKLKERCSNAANEQTLNRLIVIAAEIGIMEAVSMVTSLQKDPSQRTSFVHGFSDFPGDLRSLSDQLSDVNLKPEIRSALCIAVGRLGVVAKPATQTVLKELFQTAPDGGTHSAARWALMQQGLLEEELVELIRHRPSSDMKRGWEHLEDAADLTMIEVPSREFAMGAVTDGVDGDEVNGWKGDPTKSTKPMTFPTAWMSDREITVGQFEAILPKKYSWEISWEKVVEVSDRPRMPKANVSWYDAIEFCNALSVKQGLKPFYKFSKSQNVVRGADGHIEKATFVNDKEGEHGYRLPTEVEWEYACRALSAKGYCFGESTTLLPEYAVYRSSVKGICGHRIPNSWGLFDMHGNVEEWCWDEDETDDEADDSRVIRGGYNNGYYPETLRAASRISYGPSVRAYHVGFRIARTP